MRVSEITGSNPQGTASDEVQLRALLWSLFEAADLFTYYIPLLGEPCSVFLLSTSEVPGCSEAEPFQPPVSVETVTELFFQQGEFMKDARYDPKGEFANTPGVKKGWRVERCCFLGKPAVILWATWVPDMISSH